MKASFPHMCAGTASAVVILLGCFGCARDAPSEVSSAVPVAERELVLSEEARANLGLGLHRVGAGELRDHLQLQGEVGLDPTRVALVPARLTGVADSVAGTVGDAVEAGAELAVISSRELSDAIMGYVTTEWAFRHSIHVLERERTLREKDINSEEQLMEAEHEYHAAEGVHSVALQRLHLLGYTETQLHGYLERPDLQDLTRYTVRAPIPGWILERNLERGAAVVPGQELFRVADLTQLTVRFRLPLRHLRAVRSGMVVNVVNEALDTVGEAEITTMVNQVDPGSRTVLVKAALANPNLRWRPGMPARIDISGIGTPVSCVVPLAAVHEWEGRSIVFVRTESGAAFKLRFVRLGREDAQRAEVLDGLIPGEEVAAANSFLLLAEWENLNPEG